MSSVDETLPEKTEDLGSLPGALGLSSDSGPADKVDFGALVANVAAAWPLAFLVQLVSVLVVGTAASRSGDAGLLYRVIGASGVIIALGGTAFVTLRLKVAQQWSSFRHVRLAVFYGTGQSAALMLLLWNASLLPNPDARLASVVAAISAMAMTAVALHSLRAAHLAFAGVLAAILLLLAGPSFGSGIGFACLVCLAIATRILAFKDVANARRVLMSDGDGRLAARLVREFEEQGTGWFWQTDSDGRLTYLSGKVAAVLSEPNLPPLGRPLTALLQMDGAAPGTERTLGFHMSSRTGFSDYTVRPARLGQMDHWWSISGRPMIDSNGRFQGFVGSGADLTEKRRAEAEITRLALFDELTGLANRQRMRVALDQSLNQPNAPYRPTALFLLDLDRFKVVNDTLGHQVGDTLLTKVGQRLLRSVGDAGLVGRQGGDEFQVVLPDARDAERLSDLARNIIFSLSQPYSIDGTTISIGCSIGVAIAPNDGADSETLIRNADLALYAAKADGRGVHRFYREEMLHGAQNRKQLEDDLRDALVQDQLRLVYQPIVCAKSELIVGFEALLRWDHPTRGAITPTDFVPVAEDCGLIEAIGEWALRTACMDAAAWPAQVRVGVNVSPIQFANPALSAIITSALAKAGLDAHRLELEITEGVFLDESASTDAMFKSLKGIGVRLALDDFGTGYSSLGYLKNAPLDKIKIDQGFVRGAVIPGNRNAAIIGAIVALANTLSMETTAEGAETQDEIALIRQLGCSHIQGFVYGKPVPASAVPAMLAENGGFAKISGFKVSRAPRPAIIRKAMLEVSGARGEVRIRNISSTGAMIDGIDFGRNAHNVDVLIELVEGQMFAAKVRWAKDGKAGIEFAESFNLERLGAASEPQRLRRSA
ncbi:MAG: EAL domain-containing protein [Sphingomonas sp.]|jgi:diguanylate cyclase (GGDEF)-like protein